MLDHVAVSSMSQIRDGWRLRLLAEAIVERLDRAPPVWTKWDDGREALAKAAMLCWIPLGDLRDHLNGMGGVALTGTDVAQRLRAFHEEESEWPDEDLKAGCLALYEAERAQGTELRAIIGALQEHIEAEAHRLAREREEAWRRVREEAQKTLEARFLNGAECGWTPVNGSKCHYRRLNGRAFRLTPTPDKMWLLHGIEGVDDEGGELIGKYRRRGDVTKALSNLAG